MKTLKATLTVIFTGLFLLLNTGISKACTFKAAFTGDTLICPGSSVNYLSKLTAGHYYRWVVTGGTVVSGAGTDSIIVSWPFAPGGGSVKLIDSTSACKDSTTKRIKIGLSSALLTLASYDTLGAATHSAGNTYILTPNLGNKNSAVWNEYRINLNKNFDFTFTTNQNGGADGMMFIMQNTGVNAYNSAGQGSDMGYYNAAVGNMDQSIGLEEDLYNSTPGYADSSAGHLNLVRNKNFQPIRKQVNISTLGNGSDNTLRITWVRDANLLEIYFNGTKEFSWPTDIVKTVFGGNPYVWFGFTAATGGVTSTQTITPDSLIYDQASIVSSNDTVCAGDSVTLTANAGIAYSWSTGATTRTIKTAKSGTYSVTVTDSFSCSVTSASITINIDTVPRVKASFLASNACVGLSVPITNNSTPSSGVKYLWKFGNGSTSTSNPPSYSYTQTGNYNISLTAHTGGCIDSASTKIIVYTHPQGMVLSKGSPFQGQFNTGDIFNSDNACIGDTISYQISSPNGLSNSDYGKKWIIASKTFATAGGTLNTDTIFKNPTSSKNAYFEFFPDKSFADSVLILTLHVQLLPGNCDTLITRYINVRPNAISKFSFTNACAGFSLSFSDSSTIDKGDAISNWNWDFGDSTTSTQQNPRHAYTQPGSYKVTLSATSNANCGIPVTQTVMQYPEPVSKFGVVLGCQKANSVFTDSSSISSGSIISQNWYFGDRTISTLKNPSHIYAKSGPYQVKLVVASASGCKDSLTKQIRVEPSPVAGFGYKNACVGTAIFMANKSTDSSSGTTYHWDFGDGSAASTSAAPSHIFKSNGTYNTVLIVTSAFGCRDTTSQKITPNPAPTVNFVYSGACTKNAVAFGDSDKNGAGATYTWSFGDGSSDVASTDTAEHIYNSAGTNKVLLTIENAEGCKDTESRNVTIIDYPVASFSTQDVCVGKPSVFNNSTPGAGLTYLWDFGDTLSGKADTSSLQSPAHTYGSAGSYNVILLATNAGGCTDTMTQAALVVAPPTIDKWTYKIHNDIVSFVPQDSTQKTYKWYFGTGDSSSAKKPVYTYQTKGKYNVKLVVTNATGCSASYSDSIALAGLGVETVTGPKNNMNISIYPNPFENKTTISYILSGISTVNVSVYDIQGKLVAELKNGSYGAGKYEEVFDAAKYNANDGIYLVKMTVNEDVFTSRVVEMR